MTDISKYTEPESSTVQAIYDHYKKVGDSQPQRGYLGASIIGHPCGRYLWYCFRQCCKTSYDGRMYRLFETGQLEEERLINDLVNIGREVHGSDDDGKQFAVEALGGHFSGHMDGCALGIPEAPKTWHVLEFKTHNAKSFKKLTTEGVQISKPMHYAQMQVYMLLSGMARALYLAVNKDTDEIYAERVKLDKAFAQSMIDRAECIIESSTPPDKLSERSDYWQCQYCDAKEICHPGANSVALPILQLSCRQCCHATPDYAGGARWVCEARNEVTIDERNPCDKFMCLPDLITFAIVDHIDGDDMTLRCMASGVMFKHGPYGYTGNDLMELTEAQLQGVS